MKQILILVLVLFFKTSVFSQNIENSNSLPEQNNTTLLLNELRLKVEVIKNIQDRLSIENFISAVEKEELVSKLNYSKEDFNAFVYQSIRPKCIKENRQLEIAEIVKVIDVVMAQKFIDSHNNHSTNR